MSPNFWGCRCCGRQSTCIFRMLDSSGNQLWTWNKHQIYHSFGYRNDGFCLSPDGYIGHVGGDLEPTSFGVLDPDGATVWQYGGGDFTGANGLRFPAFDDDLNLYAVTGAVLYSYDIDGNFRWSATLPLHCSFDGVRCGGDIIYVFSHTVVTAFSKSGASLGSRAYTSNRGSLTFGIDPDGHAVMFTDGTGGATPVYEILDDDCSVISSIPYTRNITGSTVGILPNYGFGILSDGRLATAGMQNWTFLTGRGGVYDLSNDTLMFYCVPPYSDIARTNEHTPSNTVYDGDGAVYCVDKHVFGGSTLTVDGLTVLKYSETGAMQYTITETVPDGDYLSNQPYRAVQLASIPGRLLLASGYPRPVSGWTLETP